MVGMWDRMNWKQIQTKRLFIFSVCAWTNMTLFEWLCINFFWFKLNVLQHAIWNSDILCGIFFNVLTEWNLYLCYFFWMKLNCALQLWVVIQIIMWCMLKINFASVWVAQHHCDLFIKLHKDLWKIVHWPFDARVVRKLFLGPQNTFLRLLCINIIL
jgi:hypothetical protein